MSEIIMKFKPVGKSSVERYTAAYAATRIAANLGRQDTTECLSYPDEQSVGWKMEVPFLVAEMLRRDSGLFLLAAMDGVNPNSFDGDPMFVLVDAAGHLEKFIELNLP